MNHVGVCLEGSKHVANESVLIVDVRREMEKDYVPQWPLQWRMLH